MVERIGNEMVEINITAGMISAAESYAWEAQSIPEASRFLSTHTIRCIIEEALKAGGYAVKMEDGTGIDQYQLREF